MNATTFILAATAASALVGLFLLAASRRSGQTRDVGFKQARKLEPTKHTVGTAEDWARMTADQVLADAMTRRHGKVRGRIAALAKRLRHREARVAHAEQNLSDTEARLQAARGAAEGQRPPALSGRTLKLLYVLLYTGDLVVITAAILAESAQTPPGLALLSATALATALFVVGKFLGHHAREWMDQSDRNKLGIVLVGVFSCLTVFGMSLMILRLGSIWAWLVLSISPALGAAALMTLGPTVEQTEADKHTRERARAQRRRVKAQRALDDLDQEKDQLHAESSYDMRSVALRAEAQLVRLGIDRANGRQYMIDALRDCNIIAAAIHGEATPADLVALTPDPSSQTGEPCPPAGDALCEPDGDLLEQAVPAHDGHYHYEGIVSGNGGEPVGTAASPQ